jgi:hypothetical protein
MRLRLAAAAAAIAVLAFAAPAVGQAPGPGAAANLQGNDAQSWINDPHWRSFYELTKATLAKGAANVDVADFEQKSFAIFRDFGEKRGVGAAHMQDHLKLIPRQIVQIVKEDPKVLDSYANFVDATFGPQ